MVRQPRPVTLGGTEGPAGVPVYPTPRRDDPRPDHDANTIFRGVSAVAFGPGTIDLWRVRKPSPDDRGMPPPVLLILIAVTFVVVLCLALWGIAEMTGGAGSEDGEPTH